MDATHLYRNRQKTVWLISHIADDYSGGEWVPDVDYGVFLSREAAEAKRDELNEEKIEHWLQFPAESEAQFRGRTAVWAFNNIDLPEEKRMPRPKRNVRRREDFPEGKGYGIVEVEAHG